MPPNPFLTIWLSPRETIRRIVEWNPTYCVLWLACLAGAVQLLDPSTVGELSAKIPIAIFLVIALVLGSLFGLLQLWILSGLIRWTGRWLGGVATWQQLRAAVAWGDVPSICALSFYIVALMIGGPELFTKPPAHMDAPLGRGLLYAVVVAVEVVLGIWSFVTTCHTIAEVQGYRSAWRGLGNVLLTVAILMAVLFVFVFIAIALAVGLSSRSVAPHI